MAQDDTTETPMRVLAVDDNPLARDLIPALFPQPEFSEIRLAASGEETLQILAEEETPFDCFLLDIEMPGMDGIDLCARIRGMSAYRDTPIIMLTARDDIGAIEQSFAAGATDHLVKRYRVKEFVGRVRVAKRSMELDRVFHVQPGLPDSGDTMVHGRPGKHPFKLSDTLMIQGADRLILPFSLGNYLTQMPRLTINTCKIFGVGIEDIQLMYRYKSTQEYAAILKAVSDAILRVAGGPNVLMAYSGSGNFICVGRDITLPDARALEIQLTDELAEMSRQEGHASLRDIELNVGAAAVPSTNRTLRVRLSFERTLARIEARAISKVQAGANRRHLAMTRTPH